MVEINFYDMSTDSQVCRLVLDKIFEKLETALDAEFVRIPEDLVVDLETNEVIPGDAYNFNTKSFRDISVRTGIHLDRMWVGLMFPGGREINHVIWLANPEAIEQAVKAIISLHELSKNIDKYIVDSMNEYSDLFDEGWDLEIKK